jgi:hypothetical protein
MSAAKLDHVLTSLEEAADKLGVKVSYESLQESVGGGGLCKVKGTYRIIIDKRGTVGEKLSTLARALAGFDLAGIHLKPEARDMVAQYRALTGSAPALVQGQ